MIARAEVKRPLQSWGSASQSAQRSAGMSGKGNPSLDSESGATLPLFAFDFDVSKQRAQGEACRHEGLLPVRAETLGSVCEANKARPRRGMHKAITAEHLGYCLLCNSFKDNNGSSNNCSCTNQRQHSITAEELLTVVCLPANNHAVIEKHWHLCTTKGCRTLLIVPDNRPAVRCPVCEQITQQKPTTTRLTAIEALETRKGEH